LLSLRMENWFSSTDADDSEKSPSSADGDSPRCSSESSPGTRSGGARCGSLVLLAAKALTIPFGQVLHIFFKATNKPEVLPLAELLIETDT
jgi:hypothetical protein